MNKRVVALLLCLVMLVSFSACVPPIDNIIDINIEKDTGEHSQTIIENEEDYDKIDPQVLNFDTDLYTKVSLTKGYQSLESDAQRECYKLIEQSVYYISKDAEDGVYNILPVTISASSLKESELHLIITAFNFDHPEVFWVDNSFSYYSSSKTTYLKLASDMSAQQVTDSAKEMYAELREIFSGMPGDLSEFDRELYIHDKLINRCDYAYEESRDQGNNNIYTSLGGIVDNLAVCEGYTRAMQLMLSLVGIESYYVYGRGNNELHMWNSVLLDGEWYYLDATWDDKGEDGISYSNFNITTEQMLSSRSVSPLYWDLSAEEICGSSDTGTALNFNIFIPEGTSDDMSFYSNNAVTVTGFDDDNLEKIAEKIAQAAENGEEAVYLYIDPYYLDFDEAKENMFYSGDYAIFACIEMANDMLDGITISDESIATEESAELSIITIYPEYE